MPRYDYRCPSCDTVLEVEHGMREHPEVSCPHCGAPMARVLNTSGIVLKGSGFYNTDMRGGKSATEGTGAGKSDGESTALAKKEGSGDTSLAKNADKPVAPSAPAPSSSSPAASGSSTSGSAE